jgi:hypothetical protein
MNAKNRFLFRNDSLLLCGFIKKISRHITFCDTIKNRMHLQYLKIRLFSIGRCLWETGILRLVLLLFLFLFLGTVYITGIPKYYSPVLFSLIIYYFHAYRKDKFFIQLYFERKSTALYWLEYTIISFPFIILSLVKTYYADLLLYISAIFLSPFVFRLKIKSIRVGNPVFRKGSYEYQTAFRQNYWLLAICYIMAFTGLFKSNENLLYVFYVFAGLLYIFPLLENEPVLYTVNFLCVKDLFEVKLKNILCNHFILYVPFWAICLIKNIDLLDNLILFYFLIILLACSSLLLKYYFNQVILNVLTFLFVLIPLFIFSAIYPLVVITFILFILILLFIVNNRLSDLLCYK